MTTSRAHDDSATLFQPASARIDNFVRGGSFYLLPDRHFVEERTALWPDFVTYMAPRTQFAADVVESAHRAGVTQFLDLGAGFPGDHSVAHIARQHIPDARVLAIDSDPMVARYWAAALHAGRHRPPAVSFQQHDLTDAQAPISAARQVFDLQEPVCIVVNDVLHFLGGDRGVRHWIEAYQAAVPAGSRLAISHLTADHAGTYQAEQIDALAAAYRDIGSPLYPRTHDEVTDLFGTWTVGAPGVLSLRPGWPADELGAIRWGAVAVKTA